MEYQTLEITVQYAEDLHKVNFISKMDVYVVVSISGGDESSKQRTKTPVNHGGDADPTWSFPMVFAVEEAALRQNRLVLDLEIKCERTLGDRLIGEVHVPVKELLDFPANVHGGATAAKNFISYQVTKPGGRPKGKLTFSYRFRGKSGSPPETPIAYPVVDSPNGLSLIRLTKPNTAYHQEIQDMSIPPETMIAYPVVEPISQYLVMEPTLPYPPAPTLPPLNPPAGAMIKQEWYPYPPPPPQGYFGHSPPVMQLAPDWWIVDWRYDARCTGF